MYLLPTDLVIVEITAYKLLFVWRKKINKEEIIQYKFIWLWSSQYQTCFNTKSVEMPHTVCHENQNEKDPHVMCHNIDRKKQI